MLAASATVDLHQLLKPIISDLETRSIVAAYLKTEARSERQARKETA